MSFIIKKSKNAVTTLWNHKKKAIFAVIAAGYGLNWLTVSNRDQRIRTFYALEAKKYGDMPVRPLERLQRVTVLINSLANQRKGVGLFEKNALPLLNLAGYEVNIIKTKNEEEMEQLASVLDKNDTDCIYVVGGDGTLTKVLNGLARNKEYGKDGAFFNIPLGIFPAGIENQSLVQLAADIFTVKNDVRRYCESAMAIIENSRISVAPIKCQIINNTDPKDSQTFYLLSSLKAGWFEHCENKKIKLWYWGSLKDRFVYLWEFLKRSPEPISLKLCYDEFCSGCRKCRSAPIIQPKIEEKRSWVQMFVGNKNSEKSNQEKQIDYSKIINENCKTQHELSLKATDLRILCQQAENCSELKFKAGGSNLSRINGIFEGWRRKSQNFSINADSPIFETQFSASKILLEFLHFPEFIQKLSIGGDWNKVDNFATKTFQLETMTQKISLFVPKSNSRINIKTI